MTKLLQFPMKYLKKALINVQDKGKQTLTTFLLTIGVNYNNISI